MAASEIGTGLGADARSRVHDLQRIIESGEAIRYRNEPGGGDSLADSHDAACW